MHGEEEERKYVLSMASYACKHHYVVCAWMGDKDCLSKPRECEVMYKFYYIKKILTYANNLFFFLFKKKKVKNEMVILVIKSKEVFLI